MVALMPAGNVGYAQGLTVPGITPSDDSPTRDANAQLWGLKPTPEYWSHSKLKRAYAEYLYDKRMEIAEQQEARRYRHGAHWTAEQIQVFNKRKQPVVTFNRIGRKVDGIVGLVEKLRQDPKAYARKPDSDMQADLATACLRCLLDETEWKDKTPFIAGAAAVDGIGGVEMILDTDEFGGQTIMLEEVDIEGFFYDPRSKKNDFRDAIYMGVGKWVDIDLAKSMLPGHDEELTAAINDTELTTNADSDMLWHQGHGELKSVRLVNICYMHNGGWCWALFTGAHVLAEGHSEFVDKKGNGICKFLMFSAAVDHDRDRYGFVRNLKSAQDEINQRRSKGLHELNVRRIISEKGAFDDVEEARREAARPDGVVERNKGYEAEFDDAKKAQDIQGHIKFLEDAKAEVENFGPNPALLGSEGISNRSGRAISLLQQAGIAELGPYMVTYRSWKLRVYRALYLAIKRYWTHERIIRVSDVEGEQQRVPINQPGPPNMLGQPTMINPVAALDVDIVLDEGPDTVTMRQDMYETLSQVIPAIAPMLSPPQVQAVIEMLIESSELDARAKKRFQIASQQAAQPDPLMQQMKQLQLQDAQTKIGETQSKTTLNYAKAQEAGMPDQAAPQQGELPLEIQVQEAQARMAKDHAAAQHTQAKAAKEITEAQLAPMRALHEQDVARADVMSKTEAANKMRTEATIMPFDLAQRAFDAAKDRQVQREKPAAGAR
jgi:hypothetical protein